MKTKYTAEQKEYLISNYHKLGLASCATNLSLEKSRCRGLIHRFKLKLSPEYLSSPAKAKIPPELYSNGINSPSLAYFLGYLWADGYIASGGNRIRISIAKKDADEVKDIFLQNIKFNVYDKPTKHQPQISFETSDVLFHRFLEGNDYIRKSLLSPRKILNCIFPEIRHCFWLGYFDGDGCIRKKSRNQYAVSISGSHSQDWSDFLDLLATLSIKSSLLRKRRRCGDLSHIEFHKKVDIYDFGMFIYGGYDKPRIGLKRKYLKWKECVDSIKRAKKHNSSQYVGISFSKRYNSWSFGVNRAGIRYRKAGFPTEAAAHVAQSLLLSTLFP